MVKKTEYKIYTERECKEEPYRKKVQLFGYVVGENAPVVLICPGGAYKFISDFNEGEPFAREFNKRGINAFVLFYSVGYNARYPRPVKDVARSMQFIKANAERPVLTEAIFLLWAALRAAIFALSSLHNAKDTKPNTAARNTL